ncbi:pre-mRNA 3' end processing protein WDR33 isoform X3 [Dermacentor andersoni]|uniref:pre-mRNA 3' end processing protein WDR33 isoform X3 n=1 Tax=Dermacentor andersoni TaxID=34620 RepID=UPI00241634B7|nr:pre-mRNA 3' end processing protein WDR33-like isoform X3 [Dermacentor andersoni]
MPVVTMQVIQTQPMTPGGRFQYGGGPKYGGYGGGRSQAGGTYGPVGGRPGMSSMQSIEFDGKRLRKAVARKTVDYNTAVVEYLENRVWQRDYRDARALQPDSGYYTRLMPPLAMLANPINAVTTKFVRTSTNKMRCPIFCVVWTPEGRRLITGASSGEFTLWNGLTFNFETILQAHDSSVRCMVWSHNDTWMVTGDHSGYVKYWQSNMNNVKMFQGHKEAIRGISFCPTDTKFTTCSDDGTVRVWDFLRCFEEKILRGHGADVKCVDWHPQKSLIVSGSKDSQQPIKLWDPKSGQSLATLHAHKSTVMEVKWNRNGNWLLTASRDHLLKLFDIRKMNQEMQTFRGHKKEACSLAWHPIHECLFASGGSDGAVMFWMVGADKEVGAMENAHDSCVWSLAWHPLGHILCSGSNDHTSKFWTRNRPGDKMRDKYNLNTLPRGLDDTGEYDEPTTTPASATPNIPGMGLEQSTLEAVRALSDVQTQAMPSAGGGGRKDFGGGGGRELGGSIPGLDFGEEVHESHSGGGGGGRHKRTPFSKPIPKHFQQQWMENKQPLLLAPPPPDGAGVPSPGLAQQQQEAGADGSQLQQPTVPGMTPGGMNLQQPPQQQPGMPMGMMGQPQGGMGGFTPVGGLLGAPPHHPSSMMFSHFQGAPPVSAAGVDAPPNGVPMGFRHQGMPPMAGQDQGQFQRQAAGEWRNMGDPGAGSQAQPQIRAYS